MRETDSQKIVSAAFADLAPPGSGILLAVSGGSDSLGMLYFAAHIAPQLNYRLKVICVDHGLRDVRSELELVATHASSLSVEYCVVGVKNADLNKIKPAGSLQAWAREVRYRLIQAVAEEQGFSFVATGHTLDDQAETVLQRISRGTGIRGLAGIPQSRPLTPALTLIRPLLGVTRTQIKRYLKDRNREWASDPSNTSKTYSRNRIRMDVIPALRKIYPGFDKHLAALADDAAAIASFVDGYLMNGEKTRIIRELYGMWIRKRKKRRKINYSKTNFK